MAVAISYKNLSRVAKCYHDRQLTVEKEVNYGDTTLEVLYGTPVYSVYSFPCTFYIIPNQSFSINVTDSVSQNKEG